MSKHIDIDPIVEDLNESVELLENLYGDIQGARIIKNIVKEMEETKPADVEPVRYGDWVLKAKHYFNDYGYCEVYVDASCSKCKRKWHGDRIVIGKILFDYDNNGMPDPITEKRIEKCKEYCLQEAGKFMLTESPFCEKCGAKMNRKESEQ